MKFLEISRSIVKQKNVSLLTKAIEYAVKGIVICAKTMTVFSVIIHLLGLSDKPAKFLGMLTYTLQLVIYLALLKLNLPVNLTDITSALVKAVSFDIFDGTVDWDTQTAIKFN